MEMRSHSSARAACEAPVGQLLSLLLQPYGAYAKPIDVLRDEDLTLYEKRAILASWASDACAVESAPALRASPLTNATVTYDEIMDAMHALDEEMQRRCRLMEDDRCAGRAEE